MKRRTLIVISVIAPLFGYLCYYFVTPETVRAYHWHRGLLEKAAQTPVDAEEFQEISENLQRAGFTSIHHENNCTVFYYSTFMATLGPYHEIVFSRQGDAGLPDYRNGPRGGPLVKRRLANDQWYYVEHW